MTKHRVKVSMRRLLALVLLIITASGCMKEQAENCGYQALTFTVKAYDKSGSDIDPAEITSVYLYYFNTNMQFTGAVQTGIGEQITVDILPEEELYIVAWGNLNGNTSTMTGEFIDEFGIGLQPGTRATYHALPPDDLFWGSTAVNSGQNETDIELPIYRKTGSMTVTIKGLRTFTGSIDPDYSIIVGETFSHITFEGNLSGERVSYLPTGSYKETDDTYYVAPFNLIPEEEIYINIYHSSGLVATVTQDTNGDPITIKEGELTNIFIDMTNPGETGNLKVNVSLTPWGNETVWKEF